jgi:hypothetical protein
MRTLEQNTRTFEDRKSSANINDTIIVIGGTYKGNQGNPQRGIVRHYTPYKADVTLIGGTRKTVTINKSSIAVEREESHVYESETLRLYPDIDMELRKVCRKLASLGWRSTSQNAADIFNAELDHGRRSIIRDREGFLMAPQSNPPKPTTQTKPKRTGPALIEEDSSVEESYFEE